MVPRPSDPSGTRGQGDTGVIGVAPRPLEEAGRRDLLTAADEFHGHGQGHMAKA